MTPTVNWDALSVAFLHDPPDKALDVRGHVRRGERYLEAAGLSATIGKGRADDAIASAAERLPMPDGRYRPQGYDGISVSPRDGRLDIVHPLSGRTRSLDVPTLDESAIARVIAEVVDGTVGRERFLRLWRSLPDRLARGHSRAAAYALLPADTRTPDHTIWNHVDITAAFTAALGGPAGAALISFSIGPVQSFIASSKTLRDLWSGSYLLSDLAWAAMRPILDALGPQCFVYPYLRGNPRVDLWLARDCGLPIKRAPEDALLAPCFPNKFLALAPMDRAEDIARQCVESARHAWRELARRVRDEIESQIGRSFPGWDAGWDTQIEGFFDLRTTVVPHRTDEQGIRELLGGPDAFPAIDAVRALHTLLPDSDRPHYEQSPGRWQTLVEYSARLADAAKQTRHVPMHERPHDTRFKCSLLGTYSAMGPCSSEFHTFWEEAAKRLTVAGIRIRSGEHLSAVSLVKRFAPAFICKDLELSADAVRKADTATIAARPWLDAHGLAAEVEQGSVPWNGQWLHWPRRDFGKEEGDASPPERLWSRLMDARKEQAPPTYLAVLHMDGDQIGLWLAGEKSPPVRQVVHADLARYFESLPGRAEVAQAFDARRPVGPALHAAISEALGNFAIHLVPRAVGDARGELIYAGGDDVVALLPLEHALSCAQRLAAEFSGRTGSNGGAPEGYHRTADRDLLVMGPEATVSAGLAIVHFKEDLRDALEAARQAERDAKRAGRAALGIHVVRRSGEHSRTVVPWTITGRLAELQSLFAEGASDRFAYALRREEPTLGALPVEAIAAEITRLAARSEGPQADRVTRAVGAAWSEYAAEMAQRKVKVARVIEHFAVLVQTAGFLVRGRDDE